MKTRRPISIWVVSAILAGSMARGESPALPEASGPLFCGAPEFYFGWVDHRADVYHVFLLENRSEEPLAVRVVDPEPGAAGEEPVGRLVLFERVLQPGARSPVNLVFSPRRRTGSVSKDFVVELPDLEGQALTLRFTGEAREAFRIEPGELDFGRVSVEQPASRELRLSHHGHRPLQIRRLASSDPWFAVSSEAEAGAPGYRITVRTVPPLSPGPLAGEVQLVTDDPFEPEVSVPVRAEGVLPLRVQPEALVLPAGADEAEVVVTSDERDFKVIEAVAPEPIRASIEEEGSRVVRVRLSNLAAIAEMEGAMLRLATDVAVQAEILVPLRRAETE